MKVSYLEKNHFLWRGKNNVNVITNGIIDAYDIQLAKLKLQASGIEILSIQKQKKEWFSRQLNKNDILNLFVQLEILCKAGIQLNQAIEILLQQPNKSQFMNLLNHLKKSLNEGNSLHDCLQPYTAIIDKISLQLIQCGEYSGTLDLMLEKMVCYLKKSNKLKQDIKKALFYPCMVMSVTILIITFMLMFIIPRFAALFAQSHAPLPFITTAIIQLSNHFCDYSYLVFLPILLFIVTRKWLKPSPKLIYLRDDILLRLPFIGDILQNKLLAVFLRTLQVVSLAGLPLFTSLELLVNLQTNAIYQEQTILLYKKIMQGESLSSAMSYNRLFTPYLSQLIRTGEESGSLDLMLDKAACYYEEQIANVTHLLSEILEPLIIIILGVLIGGLVIAMYLPIFQLGSVI